MAARKVETQKTSVRVNTTLLPRVDSPVGESAMALSRRPNRLRPRATTSTAATATMARTT